MNLLTTLQNRVMGPHEIINYSAEIRSTTPDQIIKSEPFIGFKVLCRDSNAQIVDPKSRILQIERNLGFLKGSGCFLRETNVQMPDGFWVITMPVPRRFLNQQINNLLSVLITLKQQFGILCQNMFEINVSGRCGIMNVEQCLSRLSIPSRYTSSLIVPDNAPYKYGNVIWINDSYMCLRTKWRFGESSIQNRYEDLIVLSQLISSIYS